MKDVTQRGVCEIVSLHNIQVKRMSRLPAPKVALMLSDGGWAALADALRGEGYQVVFKTSLTEGLTFLDDITPEVAVVGLALGEREQCELLTRLDPCAQVMMLGGDPGLKPNG